MKARLNLKETLDIMLSFISSNYIKMNGYKVTATILRVKKSETNSHRSVNLNFTCWPIFHFRQGGQN